LPTLGGEAACARHTHSGRAAIWLALHEAGVGIDDIALRTPTLDDVFLTLTGHAAEMDAADETEARR
jgi:ABC-2 type transport system ATP-binding protein